MNVRRKRESVADLEINRHPEKNYLFILLLKIGISMTQNVIKKQTGILNTASVCLYWDDHHLLNQELSLDFQIHFYTHIMQ